MSAEKRNNDSKERDYKNFKNNLEGLELEVFEKLSKKYDPAVIYSCIKCLTTDEAPWEIAEEIDLDEDNIEKHLKEVADELNIKTRKFGKEEDEKQAEEIDDKKLLKTMEDMGKDEEIVQDAVINVEQKDPLGGTHVKRK